MNDLERRIIEISFKHKLSHISSCLNVVNLLAEIYEKRGENDPVVLGNSHAGVALYVILESKGFCDAEEMLERHGIHATRDMEHGVWVSGGSLGQAETVAVGLALANPKQTVWLVSSDGGCMEGAVYEAFRFAEDHCPNLKIFIIFNGLGAYGSISLWQLPRLPENSHLRFVNQERYPKFLRGLGGHYLQLNQKQYEELVA